MYWDRTNILTGAEYDPPRLMWDEVDKYAIIAWLLMCIDRDGGEAELEKFDNFIGLSLMPEDKEEDGVINGGNKKAQLRETRDTIIAECRKFIATLDSDERYELISDEIDSFIEGETRGDHNCKIGSSYANFDKAYSNSLDGGAYMLWELMLLVIEDEDYKGNKRKLLRHIGRKWQVEKEALSLLEDAAIIQSAIEKERQRLENSDEPYQEVKAALEDLDKKEKETWRLLKKMGICGNRHRSAFAATMAGLANSISVLHGGKRDFKVDFNELDADSEEEDDDDDSDDVWDRASDKVVDGINTVFGGIAEAIENLTYKLMGL